MLVLLVRRRSSAWWRFGVQVGRCQSRSVDVKVAACAGLSNAVSEHCGFANGCHQERRRRKVMAMLSPVLSCRERRRKGKDGHGRFCRGIARSMFCVSVNAISETCNDMMVHLVSLRHISSGILRTKERMKHVKSTSDSAISAVSCLDHYCPQAPHGDITPYARGGTADLSTSDSCTTSPP